GWQLRLMIDAKRSRDTSYVGENVERHQCAIARSHIDARQGLWSALKLRRDFQDYVVIVCRGVDGRRLPGSKRRIERVSNLIGSHVQGSRLVPVDVDHCLRTGQLKIAGDAPEFRKLIQSRLDRLCDRTQLGEIGPLNRILILAATLTAADLKILNRLNVD